MPNSKRFPTVTKVEKSTLRRAYKFFREQLSAIPQIRYIAAYLQDDLIHFWTIIPERVREVQRKIYNAELELMDHSPTFSYDFNVIFCPGDFTTLLPSEAQFI
ncbi:MAG: hypothetical protein A2Z21_03260 [Candidatus Fraserbacteria bacterium RBG_16_55_9]|uniref:Uncharacterized protein n=1 Tax=Fraserbacteria sp. (strain RBG_16_55_9) TaxID=1817864 RepID=A0A1F5V192_FRAXR|nr:MAG: hypothetical protein A2Z21_03260 [Candidatus Fraserbacteria bacterium RBG_16_55_9]